MCAPSCANLIAIGSLRAWVRDGNAYSYRLRSFLTACGKEICIFILLATRTPKLVVPLPLSALTV